MGAAGRKNACLFTLYIKRGAFLEADAEQVEPKAQRTQLKFKGSSRSTSTL